MKSHRPPSQSTDDAGVQADAAPRGMLDNSFMSSMMGFGGMAPNYIVANPTWDWTDAWPKTDTVEQRGDPKTGGYRIHATPQGGFEADGTIYGEQTSGSYGGLTWAGSDRYGTVENRAGLYGEEGERRIGHHHQYSMRKVNGEAHYGGLNAGFEGNGPNISFDANIGEDGAALGAQATVADAAVTLDNIGMGHDDGLVRAGVSEGEGLAGRLHWGDKDKDGYREYGFGADFGPFSFDVKSEDPLKALLGPVGNLASLAGLRFNDNKGNDNWTHAAWDTASGLATNAWDTVSGFAGDAWNTVSGVAGDAWDTVNGWAEGIDPSVIGGPLTAPIGPISEGLGNAWDTVSGWAEGIDPSVIGGPLTAPLDGVGEGLSNAWDTVSGAVGDLDPSSIGGPLIAPLSGLFGDD